MKTQSIRNLVRAACDNRDGSAGVEFALGAPILLAGLIVLTDIGLAYNEQMKLDQAARAGAEFVMGDVSDLDEIEKLVKSAATGYDPDSATNVNASEIPDVYPTKTCKCPGSDASVSCTTICLPDEVPPYTYYDILATKTYDAVFLPDFTLKTQVQVQVR